jgi:hypothetical protein
MCSSTAFNSLLGECSDGVASNSVDIARAIDILAFHLGRGPVSVMWYVYCSSASAMLTFGYSKGDVKWWPAAGLV